MDAIPEIAFRSRRVLLRRLPTETVDLLLMNAHGSFSDADVQKGFQQPKTVQEPQHHRNNHNGVENLLYCDLHRYVSIHEPQ
jgi:hypothetical protein